MGALGLAACLAAPVADSGAATAPQGGVFAAAQRNLDDAETLATAAASNLVVVQKQSRIATAEADRVVRATDTALRQSRERQASAATQVAAEQSAQSAAIMIRATSDALSAAATATSLGNANAAQATAVAIQATATANMIENTNAQRAAEWEQNVMLPARMIGLILLGAIGLFLCLRYGIQAVEALILHIRVVKDGRGNIMVIMPPDGQGRQQMVMPHLTMDPVMSLTPPGFAQTTVSSHGGDAEVARRAQAIDALGVTQNANPGATPRQGTSGPRMLQALIDPTNNEFEAPSVRVLSPGNAGQQQLTDGNAMAAIEADWRSGQ